MMLALVRQRWRTADTPAFAAGQVFPGLSATLARGQSVYVAVRYASDAPLRFQAQGYAGGRPAEGGMMMNAAPVQPAGNGTALVWIAFDEATSIDQIHITAYDNAWQPLATLPVNARLTWTGVVAKERPQLPRWVSDLIAAEKARMDAAIAATEESSSGWDMILGLIIMAGVPPRHPAWYAAGDERRLAHRGSRPLVPMGLLMVHAAFAYAAGQPLTANGHPRRTAGSTHLLGLLMIRAARRRSPPERGRGHIGHTPEHGELSKAEQEVAVVEAVIERGHPAHRLLA